MSSPTQTQAHDPKSTAPAGTLGGWHAVVSAGLLLIVATSALPLGSNRDWSWNSIAAFLGLLLVVQAFALLIDRPRYPRAAIQSMAIPAMGWAMVLVWAALQAWLPLPGLATNAMFAGLADASLTPPDNRIAIDDDAAANGIIKLLSYAAIFWLATWASFDRNIANRLCIAIVSGALVVTAVGLVTDLPRDKPLSGTFINPDNYATYAGLACIVCLHSIQARLPANAGQRLAGRALWRARLASFSGANAVWSAALLILLAGMIYSRSRGGLFAFLVAAPLGVFSLGLLQRRRLSSIVVATTFTIAALITIFLLTGGRTWYKFAQLFADGNKERVALYAMTADAILLRPIIGWGLGSFSSIYSIFQPLSLPIYYDKAHNTYLETALDLGIPAAMLFFAVIGIVAYRCAAGIAHRNRDAHFPALALTSTLFVVLHSLVDFGVQIPAAAMTFATLLGIGWAQSWSTREIS